MCLEQHLLPVKVLCQMDEIGCLSKIFNNIIDEAATESMQVSLFEAAFFAACDDMNGVNNSISIKKLNVYMSPFMCPNTDYTKHLQST